MELVTRKELQSAWAPKFGEYAWNIVVALWLAGKPGQHQFGELTAVSIKATLL